MAFVINFVLIVCSYQIYFYQKFNSDVNKFYELFE